MTFEEESYLKILRIISDEGSCDVNELAKQMSDMTTNKSIMDFIIALKEKGYVWFSNSQENSSYKNITGIEELGKIYLKYLRGKQIDEKKEQKLKWQQKYWWVIMILTAIIFPLLVEWLKPMLLKETNQLRSTTQENFDSSYSTKQKDTNVLSTQPIKK